MSSENKSIQGNIQDCIRSLQKKKPYNALVVHEDSTAKHLFSPTFFYKCTQKTQTKYPFLRT